MTRPTTVARALGPLLGLALGTAVQVRHIPPALQRLGPDLTRPDAAVISHRHGGHTAGPRAGPRPNSRLAVYVPDDEAFGGSRFPAALPRQQATTQAPPFVVPAWAFPQGSGGPAAPPVDSGTPHRLSHSRATFTEAQVRDLYAVPDWRPELHPPMPAVVAHGRRPALFACGYCHLADGMGRPENATLAGLPAAYLVEQMADLRSGARQSALASYGPGATMRRLADSATAAEVAEAAAYFAGLRPRRRSRVVEATQIPRAVAATGLYFPDPQGGVEPLGARLVEMAQDRAAHESHDPFAAYVAYVPPGSLRRGRVLATRGQSGGTAPCASCHGPALRGVGLVPPLAGRSPSYLLRQLLAFRTGTRSSAAGAVMRAQAATLDVDDMVAAAAYAGSLRP